MSDFVKKNVELRPFKEYFSIDLYSKNNFKSPFSR